MTTPYWSCPACGPFDPSGSIGDEMVLRWGAKPADVAAFALDMHLAAAHTGEVEFWCGVWTTPTGQLDRASRARVAEAWERRQRG